MYISFLTAISNSGNYALMKYTTCRGLNKGTKFPDSHFKKKFWVFALSTTIISFPNIEGVGRGEEKLVSPFQGLLRLQRKVIFVVLDILGEKQLIEAFTILFCLFLAAFHVPTLKKKNT